MKIIVNGQPHDTEATTLDDLLTVLGYEDAVVATALNGEFVPVAARPKQHLGNGDRIEVLAPMQGG